MVQCTIYFVNRLPARTETAAGYPEAYSIYYFMAFLLNAPTFPESLIKQSWVL